MIRWPIGGNMLVRYLGLTRKTGASSALAAITLQPFKSGKKLVVVMQQVFLVLEDGQMRVLIKPSKNLVVPVTMPAVDYLS